MKTKNQSALPGQTAGRALFDCAATLMVGGVFVAVQLLTDGWPGWRPVEAWQWLPFVAAVACVIPAVGFFAFHSTVARHVIALFTIVSAATLYHTPASIGLEILWQLMLGAAALALWLSLHPLIQRRGYWFVFLGMTISITASTFLIYEHCGFATLSLPMAGVAAAMVVITIICAIKTGASIVRAALVPAIIINCAALLLAWLYARDYTGVPWYSVAGVGIAPAGLWLADMPFLENKTRRAHAIGIVATAAVAAISLIAA